MCLFVNFLANKLGRTRDRNSPPTLILSGRPRRARKTNLETNEEGTPAKNERPWTREKTGALSTLVSILSSKRECKRTRFEGCGCRNVDWTTINAWSTKTWSIPKNMKQATRPVEDLLLHWMLPKQPFIRRDGEKNKLYSCVCFYNLFILYHCNIPWLTDRDNTGHLKPYLKKNIP